MAKRVHILKGGRALCGMPGLPGEWPPGNVWVGLDDPAADCEACVAVRDDVVVPEPAIYTKATEGKYDAETAALLQLLNAEAVLVIVKQGESGDGFSAAIDLRKVTAQEILRGVPSVLRSVANEIEQQERDKAKGVQ